MTLPTMPDSVQLEFTTIAKGGHGGPKMAVEAVIRDAEALADFFDGDPPDFDVDWNREVVTAVALGERGTTAHSITIESIRFYTLGIRGGTADIHYREGVGEVGGDALTYPFHVVKSRSFGQAGFYRTSPAELPPALFQDWRILPRWEPDGVATYVPRTKAEASRTVAGFVIRPDGSFTKVDDGPNDAPFETQGRWHANHKGISVKLSDGREFILEIISVNEQELRASRTDSA